MKSNELSMENRGKISALNTAGCSCRKIVDKMRKIYHVNVSKSTVGRLINNEKLRGTLANKPRSGRPRKTTIRIDRSLVRIALENRKNSLKTVSNNLNLAHGIKVSKQTISRRLTEAGLGVYRCRRKPMLSAQNIHKRRNWAVANISKPIDYWKSVIWSDESRFCLISDRPENCIRRPNEALKSECLTKTVKHDEGIMVWGCFSFNGVGQLAWIDRLKIDSSLYCQILKHTLYPSIEKLHPDGQFIFQQDNAPCHTSKMSKKWIEQESIPLITDWPPQSPDLNPIENLWDYIDRKIREYPIKNRNDLWEAVQKVWHSIDKQILEKLVLNIPDRLNSVIKNKGGATNY